MAALAARVRALSPFGPIFGMELRVTARRKRSYALRFLYLGALLLVLLWFWMMTSYSRGGGGGAAARAQAQEELGKGFFACFVGFTTVAMALIGPILTATAISSERLGRTLHVLMVTPITTWQVISGKLASRLLVALTLIGLSLPVLALSRLFGGVELSQMIGAVCLAATVAIHAAAIGLFFSTVMKRAFAVILLSYATIAFVQIFVPFVAVAFSVGSGRVQEWFWAHVNWGFAIASLVEPTAFSRMSGRFGFGAGVDPWVVCCAIYLLLAGVLVFCSGLLLRRAVRREGGNVSAPDPTEYIPVATAFAPRHDAAGPTASAAPPLPMPLPTATAAGATASVGAATADPAAPARAVGGPLGYSTPKSRGVPRSARPRDVSDNPVLWRELRRPLTARRWQAVTFSAIAILLLLISYATLAALPFNGLDDDDVQIGYAFVFQAVLWVLVAVVSATSVAQEKESDTWTLLLTTPVSGRTIVFGKAAGLLRRLMWPYALAAAHFAVFTVTGVIRPATFGLILWVLTAFNSVWLATGVYLSLRLRTVTFAVILNLLLAVVAYPLVAVLLMIGGEWLAAPDQPAGYRRRGGEAWVEQVAWYLPYSYLAIGVNGLNNLNGGVLYDGSDRFWLPRDLWAEPPSAKDPNPWSHPYHRRGADAGAYLMIAFVAGAAYLLTAVALLAWTADRFDRIVERAPQRRGGGGDNTPALPAAASAAAG